MALRWFFGLFLVSGFCGLVYQVVWLRLAMAAFGVTAPLVSIVLSVFMAGLAMGSWGGGVVARRLGRSPSAPFRLYALAELIVAASGERVPQGLAWGRSILAGEPASVAWGSLGHYVVSAALISLVLLPFCVCMGATFPLAMAAVRGAQPSASQRSFSYLYLANVLGAFTGTLVSALVLVELVGFRGTLEIAASLNALLAAVALALSLGQRLASEEASIAPLPEASGARFASRTVVLATLFVTGFSSMGMEVVWVRQFTPYLGTVVYAFAVILALYLAATFAGSALYRRSVARRGAEARLAIPAGWSALGVAGLLPLLAADPRLGPEEHFLGGTLRAALGIGPLCLALGYFTPMLMDRWSLGDARRAGSAYALNMVGCILGPMAAGFLLLPWIGERWAILALAAPLFGLRWFDARPAGRSVARPWVFLAVATAALLVETRDFETLFPERAVLRDYAATVVATDHGMTSGLRVNGVGMTKLTPITKLMAHLPLAFADTPRHGLALCFGMGVTFRSMRSWGIETTAVELVPSVPRLFGYFHPGQEGLLTSPGARVVIDDARRFLERTRESFDVVTLDPPPPIEGAGASLLYSREFYALAAKRLSGGGVLQQWLPAADHTVAASVARAILESFPHVRTFSSVEGWGVHFLASHRPLPPLSAAAAAGRLPPAAVIDLLEWGPGRSAEEQFQLVLGREFDPSALLRLDPLATALRDDRPVNEYYLLRRTFPAAFRR